MLTAYGVLTDCTDFKGSPRRTHASIQRVSCEPYGEIGEQISGRHRSPIRKMFIVFKLRQGRPDGVLGRETSMLLVSTISAAPKEYRSRQEC